MAHIRSLPRVLVALTLLAGLTILAPPTSSAGPPTDSGTRLVEAPIARSSIDTLVVTSNPAVLLSDPVAHRVLLFTGGTPVAVVGDGSSGIPVPGDAQDSPMISPTSMALDEANDVLYIADTGANMVVRVDGLLADAETAQLSIVAGTGVAGSPDFTGGPEFNSGAPQASTSKLNAPHGLAEVAGLLFISDTGNDSVVVVDLESDQIYPITGPYASTYQDENGDPIQPSVSQPRGLMWDLATYSILIADTGNHRVMSYVLPMFGNTYTVVAGTGVEGAVTPGPATASNLSEPVSIDVNPLTGGYALVDSGNHQILDIDEGILSVVAGTGSADPIDFDSVADPLGPASVSLGSISQVRAFFTTFLLVDSTNNIIAVLAGASAPGAPTVSGATPGNGSASISFTAPADNGGRAITKYQYKVGTGSWTDAVGTTSPITITGLTNYQTANVRLRAVNSAGAGAASSSVSVMPRQAGPAAAAAAPSGRTGIVVTFNLNPLPGTTVAYQSVVAYAEGTITVAGTCRTYARQTTCYIGGLTRGTIYDLRVTAHLPVPGKTWHATTAAGSTLQVGTNK